MSTVLMCYQVVVISVTIQTFEEAHWFQITFYWIIFVASSSIHLTAGRSQLVLQTSDGDFQTQLQKTQR